MTIIKYNFYILLNDSLHYNFFQSFEVKRFRHALQWKSNREDILIVGTTAVNNCSLVVLQNSFYNF